MIRKDICIFYENFLLLFDLPSSLLYLPWQKNELITYSKRKYMFVKIVNIKYMLYKTITLNCK